MLTPPSLSMNALLRFLGSMNLAITLLLSIALASVIGTILKQNEPYQNYIVKFGPYWHHVFEQLGLYDIYAASWFILILAFLVISTSICLYRNTPRMLASIRHYQENRREEQLVALPNHLRHETALSPDETVARLSAYLARLGFKIKIRERAGVTTLAAMKGAANRFGYIFTHLAIVIICIGGLLDSNVPLKMKSLRGELVAETKDLPLNEIRRRAHWPLIIPPFVPASPSLKDGL